MIVCDRCLSKKHNKIQVNFEKVEQGKKPRRMLAVEMTLCEKCISELLKQFGKLKVTFCNEETENKESGTVQTSEQVREPVLPSNPEPAGS